jgi:copper chaperone CopZ
MAKTTLELPNLYGDHHVTEVRRILLEMPGVEDVYASSAFRTVEVTYDPAQVNDLEIQVKLDEAGYLGEWSVPAEVGLAPYARGGDESAFRHTAVYEATRLVVSFARTVPGGAASSGRPLWTCPGMGVIKKMED